MAARSPVGIIPFPSFFGADERPTGGLQRSRSRIQNNVWYIYRVSTCEVSANPKLSTGSLPEMRGDPAFFLFSVVLLALPPKPSKSKLESIDPEPRTVRAGPMALSPHRLDEWLALSGRTSQTTEARTPDPRPSYKAMPRREP